MRVMILAALAALAACGQSAPAPYPPEYELNFMRACQVRQTTAQCSCIWGKIETDVPVADFIEVERLPASERASHPITGQVERFALECAAQLQPPIEDPPPP
jgi:hypothetical protein